MAVRHGCTLRCCCGADTKCTSRLVIRPPTWYDNCAWLCVRVQWAVCGLTWCRLLVFHVYAGRVQKVHCGREPDYTFPTGLTAPTMDTDPPLTTDYVWVSSGVKVVGAILAANKPHPADPSVYPSDHVAVLADIAIPARCRASHCSGETVSGRIDT